MEVDDFVKRAAALTKEIEAWLRGEGFWGLGLWG